MGRSRKIHKHDLYEAAVQSPEADLDFFDRIWRKKRGGRFKRLREDFCGTSVICCEWVRRKKANEAWGVDLHRPTLEWGRRHRVGHLGDAASRVHLLQEDVLGVTRPAVDVVCALNFSYSVFKQRDVLRRYFRTVRESLGEGGIFFVDAWGGPETMEEMSEPRRIDATKAFDGTRIPAFKYVWEQTKFNPVTHEIVCHIHFKLKGGKRIRRAFTYDWRLWTLPELQELILEAGFAQAEVYVEGWDDEADDTDGIFRRRKRFESQDSWVAYVVGLT